MYFLIVLKAGKSKIKVLAYSVSDGNSLLGLAEGDTERGRESRRERKRQAKRER